MKKIFILIFLAFAFTASAQNAITLTDSNFRLAIQADAYKIDTANAQLPSSGINQLWNYRTLNGIFKDSLKYSVANDTMFPNAIRIANWLFEIDTISTTNELFQDLNSNAFWERGIRIVPQDIGLGGITGNASDKIRLSQHYIFYNNPVLDFPCTYKSKWSSQYRVDVPFRVTVSPFLLNTPGEFVSYLQDSSEVSGWGTFQIPNTKGGYVEYEALLVYRKQSFTDSMFLNGAPASPVILNALGISQGQKRDIETYSIYRMDTAAASQQLIFQYYDTGNLVETWFIEDDSRGVSVQEIQEKLELKVYPNPIQNQSFYFEFEKTSPESWQIDILNALGQVVSQIPVKQQFGKVLIEENLNQQIENGVYFYHLKNHKNQVLAKGKLVFQ